MSRAGWGPLTQMPSHATNGLLPLLLSLLLELWFPMETRGFRGPARMQVGVRTCAHVCLCGVSFCPSVT